MAKDFTQARRGMSFENQIEITNRHYEYEQMAVIQKIATPTKNIKGKIVYSEKSTVDFIGNVDGRAVAFEAKQTTGPNMKPETSFPLLIRKKYMVGSHQLLFLQRWEKMGGMAFVLINFRNRGQCFAVPVDFIVEKYGVMQAGGRKSIPFDEFKSEWEVPIDDYLKLREGGSANG